MCQKHKLFQKIQGIKLPFKNDFSILSSVTGIQVTGNGRGNAEMGIAHFPFSLGNVRKLTFKVRILHQPFPPLARFVSKSKLFKQLKTCCGTFFLKACSLICIQCYRESMHQWYVDTEHRPAGAVGRESLVPKFQSSLLKYLPPCQQVPDFFPTFLVVAMGE